MIMRGAEAFTFQGNDIGVILVHGYTGTPAEMREMGETLNAKRGYTVRGVLLPGHGTCPEDMEGVTYQEWYACVEQAFHDLESMCSKIFIVGISMGALLTLLAGVRLPVAGIVIMSAPEFLYDRRFPFMWFFQIFQKSVPKRIRQIDAPQRYNVSYPVFPVCGLVQVKKMMRYMHKNHIVEQITVPCQIIQSRSEHTVKPRSAEYFYEKVASVRKELVWLKHSKHTITLYEARYDVYDHVDRFIGGIIHE